MYTRIWGKKKRIAFLRNMAQKAKKGSPVMLFCYLKSLPQQYYTVIYCVANIIRFLCFRERVEKGDILSVVAEKNPYSIYSHHFTKDDIINEVLNGSKVSDKKAFDKKDGK